MSSDPSGSTQSPPSIGSSDVEEGLALREWRRRNAIELVEKEKMEKEKLKQIIEEAEAYRVEFYKKREVNVEKKKGNNSEMERVFRENQEKFHAEAEKNYWKAVAEMIPREVVAVEKRGKKEREKEKKGSVVVVHGPKPGKPTDLSRMRQVLVRLKQRGPAHMNTKAEEMAVA